MKWIGWILVIAAVVAAAYYFLVIQPGSEPPAGLDETSHPGRPAVEEPRTTPGAAQRPSEAVDRPGEAGEELPEPLPPLAESDPAVRGTVGEWIGQGEAEKLLVDEALLPRFVATIDNLTSRKVARTLLPVNTLDDTLAVVPDPAPPVPITNEQGDVLNQYLLDESNYRRFDGYMALLDSVDDETLIASYRRYEQLFQEAYRDLGYPDADFNARFVEVIDHLLATPDVVAPVRLIKPEAYYVFADPELEALSVGQKLLIRITRSASR